MAITFGEQSEISWEEGIEEVKGAHSLFNIYSSGLLESVSMRIYLLYNFKMVL